MPNKVTPADVIGFLKDASLPELLTISKAAQRAAADAVKAAANKRQGKAAIATAAQRSSDGRCICQYLHAEAQAGDAVPFKEIRLFFADIKNGGGKLGSPRPAVEEFWPDENYEEFINIGPGSSPTLIKLADFPDSVQEKLSDEESSFANDSDTEDDGRSLENPPRPVARPPTPSPARRK